MSRVSAFSWFASYTEILDGLPSDELKLAFALGVAHYGTYGDEPEFEDMILDIAFKGIRPNIDSSRKRSSDGKKGGQAKARNEAERRAQAAKDYTLPNPTDDGSSTLASTLASMPSSEWMGKDLGKEKAGVIHYQDKHGKPISFGEVAVPQAR